MPTKLINYEHEYGTTVYLKSDPEQFKRIVIGFFIDKSNVILYKLAMAETMTYHYDD